MSVCIEFRKLPFTMFVLGHLSLIHIQICWRSFERIRQLIKITSIMEGSRTVQRKIMEETYNNCFKTLVQTVEQLGGLVKKIVKVKVFEWLLFLHICFKVIEKNVNERNRQNFELWMKLVWNVNYLRNYVG